MRAGWKTLAACSSLCLLPMTAKWNGKSSCLEVRLRRLTDHDTAKKIYFTHEVTYLGPDGSLVVRSLVGAMSEGGSTPPPTSSPPPLPPPHHNAISAGAPSWDSPKEENGKEKKKSESESNEVSASEVEVMLDDDAGVDSESTLAGMPPSPANMSRY